MQVSGIPCSRFTLKEGDTIGHRNEVRFIEITKLVEKKRGGGVSVPVEAFEGNNLIFVDEGHKGSGGDVWRRYRDALGESGFTIGIQRDFWPGIESSSQR